MKAIMISIKPEYTANILNGYKTLELRTTCPKEWKDYLSGKTKIKPQSTKCYIYCTKGKSYKDSITVYHSIPAIMPYIANGKVVAEFQCNEIEIIKSIKEKRNGASYQYHELNDRILKQSCLSEEQILDYTNGNDLYGWHIDNLKVYDKPKELSEFYKWENCPHYYSSYEDGCCAENCPFYDKNFCNGHSLRVERPPQSWCYVEVLEEV